MHHHDTYGDREHDEGSERPEKARVENEQRERGPVDDRQRLDRDDATANGPSRPPRRDGRTARHHGTSIGATRMATVRPATYLGSFESASRSSPAATFHQISCAPNEQVEQVDVPRSG